MATTKKTSASSASTTINSGLKMTFLNLALLIIIPYLIGVYISNQNLALVQQVLQPLISSLSSFDKKSQNIMLNANNSQQKSKTSSSLHKTTTDDVSSQEEEQGQRERSVVSSSTTTTSVTKKDSDNSVLALKCFDRLLESMMSSSSSSSLLKDKDAIMKVFDNIDIVLHHNGESQPCGHLTKNFNFVQGMRDLLVEEQEDVCPLWSNKYHVESFLTRVFHRSLLLNLDDENDGRALCSSTDEPNDKDSPVGFYGYCDRGEDRTPILLDHDKLIRIPTTETLPCHFHSQVGVRITSLSQLLNEAVQAAATTASSEQSATCGTNNGDIDDDDDADVNESCLATTIEEKKELHLYSVPAGRVFMFAPSHIGQVISLPHITGGDPTKPVELHVLSVQPRIFDITNFFTRDESNDIVQRALQESRDSHRIKRSSTGATGYNINQQRTSESGFDTEGATAMILKRRGLALLGFDEYLEGHTDGLQVLRYNLTTAYIPHMDWIDGTTDLMNNYESAEVGGNRYATILLYMSDLTEQDGGETVFVEAWPIGLEEKDRIPMSTAIRQVRESGDADMLKKGSWEETMVAQCRTRLAIRPNSAKAILFYSQKPNGEEDRSSKHGACPVLKGDKWAANLWVWNTPRPGFAGNPRKAEHKDVDTATAAGFRQVVATFTNPGTNSEHDDAELFFQEDLWAKLGRYDPPVRVNTYKGHTWTVRVQGRIVQTWTIGDDTDDEPNFVLE